MNDITKHHRHAWPNQRKSLGDRVKTAVLIAFVVIAYGLVGTLDYQDAVAMEEARTSQTTTK